MEYDDHEYRNPDDEQNIDTNELSILFKSSVPMYGFLPIGMDGKTEPIKSIEEMAAIYIKEMLNLKSTGPYQLVGYCMGGFIAYEMALQLYQQGIHLNSIVLIDSLLLPEKAYKDDQRLLYTYLSLMQIPFELFGIEDQVLSLLIKSVSHKARLSHQFFKPVIALDDLKRMDLTDQLAFVYQTAHEKKLLPGISLNIFKALFKIMKGNMHAMHEYSPGVWPGKIKFFRAMNNPKTEDKVPDAILYWRNVAKKNVENNLSFHLIVFNHLIQKMMKKNLTSFKQRLNAYEKKGYWQPYTLGEYLGFWAKKYGKHTALVYQGRRISYNELDRSASEIASGLYDLGIDPGDRVLVQLPNNIEFVFSCFALFRLGAIPILSMPASREADIDALCTLAEPVAYMTTHRFLGFDYHDLAHRMISKHPSLKYLITDDGTITGSLALNDIRRPLTDIPRPDYRDTAVLLLSGGTTGTPKLIPRTHTLCL